jgi:hypothetical protein
MYGSRLRAIPRWAVATLIVALAFGVGYGIRRVVEEEGPSQETGRVGVTFRQAASVPLDTTPDQLLRRFRGTPYETRRDAKRDTRCFVFVVSDRPEAAWSFCFRKGKLQSSSTSPR